MDLQRLAHGLPEGVRVIAGPRGVLAARADALEALLAAGYGPEDDPHPVRADAIGKRALGEVRAGERRLLVRHFQHGGLLRWLTAARFASPERPFEEWRLQSRLSALGIATPAVVAARAVRASVAGWRLDLATERVAGALDLGVLLARRRDGLLADATWRELLSSAGRFVAGLHRVGFEHGDLTPRNLLAGVEEPGGATPRMWVIDLGGSRFGPAPLDGARRAANLGRLARHLVRMRDEHGAGLSLSDRWRFLAAYAPERAERRALARALRAGGGLHRVGWLLERRFGRGRGPAETHLRRSTARP